MFNDRRRRTPAVSFAPVLAVALALGVLIAAAAVATSVIAKSFHALAVEADGVFAGAVTDVRSYRSDGGHIRTAVRFGELRWLVAPATAAGAADEERDGEKELHFAGGRLGEIAEVVGGMPQFTVGQRVVIFYRDAETASPIVGFHQGCFGLRASEAGVDTVFTADHRPVVAIEDGELVAGEAGAGGAMSLEDFAAAVSRQRGGDR